MIFVLNIQKTVQVGNDQEKPQSEKDSLSKNRGKVIRDRKIQIEV